MAIQLLSEFLYRLVEQSWIIATILVKYFLLGLGIKIVSERKFDPNYVSDQLIEYSSELVALVVLLGLINIFAGFTVEPVFKTFSQITAFLYFAFLFWKY